MGLLKDEDKQYLKSEFEKHMDSAVKLIFFGSKSDCKYCSENESVLREVAELSDLIDLEIYDISNTEAANKYGAEFAPTTIITDDEKMGGRVRFLGIPSGYEFGSVIENVIDVSRGTTDLSEDVISKLKTVDKPIKIQVFVTPTCPYCPQAVRTAHKFAMANPNITGEMVEAIEFPKLADKWHVMSVPHIVINEDVQFVGAYPPEQFVEEVLKAYNNL